MPTKRKSTSKKKSSPKVSKVRKLEAKMNQEQRQAKKATEKLNKIRKDLAKAVKGEIRTLKASPSKSKTVQQKIKNLNKIHNQCKKSYSFKAA